MNELGLSGLGRDTVVFLKSNIEILLSFIELIFSWKDCICDVQKNILLIECFSIHTPVYDMEESYVSQLVIRTASE